MDKKRCAWLSRNYLEWDDSNNIHDAYIGNERPSMRAERIARIYLTKDGRRFRAISTITLPNDEGICGNMYPNHMFLGEVYEK